MNKAVDFYEMEELRGFYIFVVVRHVTYGPFGVTISFDDDKIYVRAAKMVGVSIQTKTEYNLEIDALYEEIKKMSDQEIRNLVQSKLGLKKFDL